MGDVYQQLRMRKKLLKNMFIDKGLEGMGEKERLQLILSYAMPKGDWEEMANFLIGRYGSIISIINCSLNELDEIFKMIPADSLLFPLLREVAQLYLVQHTFSDRKGNKSSVNHNDLLENLYTFWHRRLCNENKEVLEAVYIDCNGYVCPDQFERLAYGDNSSLHFPPEQILTNAVRHECCIIAICHNHPSGNAYPSMEDCQFTEQLNQLLQDIGIVLLDHIIITKEHAFSIIKNKMCINDKAK
jgi:DNA repair protein RadC